MAAPASDRWANNAMVCCLFGLPACLPPLLLLLQASLSLFREAGGMAPLRRKSVLLTGYLEVLLQARQ